MEPNVDILLATYNGEKFLKEQLASIATQTLKNWRLIVRDDCSTDATLSIVHQFASLYPDKVVILPSEDRLGVVQNFNTLLQASSAPYVAFCDQDDVWDTNKLEVLLNAMHKLEESSPGLPILVHSDLRLVDSSLAPLAPSFWEYAHLYPSVTTSLNRLLAQNVVTGCACLFNRLLAETALPIPRETLMHDWWIALVASAFGKIGIVKQPTISYRQHGKNALGAIRFCSPGHLHKAWKRLHEMAQKKWLQTKVFEERFGNHLSIRQRACLKAYLALRDKTWMKSRLDIVKFGFAKQGFLRQSAALLLLKQP